MQRSIACQSLQVHLPTPNHHHHPTRCVPSSRRRWLAPGHVGHTLMQRAHNAAWLAVPAGGGGLRRGLDLGVHALPRARAGPLDTAPYFLFGSLRPVCPMLSPLKHLYIPLSDCHLTSFTPRFNEGASDAMARTQVTATRPHPPDAQSGPGRGGPCYGRWPQVALPLKGKMGCTHTTLVHV